MVRDGGVIAAGYSGELDQLRALQTHSGDFLAQLEARERARTGIPNLRVAYNNVHGFYIEITNTHAGKVPADYRRRQTLKNAERYITPELKEFEDKALSARDRALALEKSLYDELLGLLAPHVPALQRIARALAQLDQGTYGQCSSCGQPIGARRMSALPYSDLCISCAEAAG